MGSRHILDAPWFYRFGFLLGRTVPKCVLYRVADVIGELSRLCASSKDHSVRENLKRVFPEATPQELARLSGRIFRNFTRYMVDFGRFRSMDSEQIRSEISSFDGIEHLQAVIAAGTGVLLVTGHIGNWELGGLFMAQGLIRTNVVTLPEGRKAIDDIRMAYRNDHGVRTIVMDDSPFAGIEMAAALRRGELVAMVVDRWGGKGGVAAPLFGTTHMFPCGPFALSRVTGTPVLPAFVVRSGSGYRAIVDPPFHADGLDDEACAVRIAESMERIVRKYADQWYNFTPLNQSSMGIS